MSGATERRGGSPFRRLLALLHRHKSAEAMQRDFEGPDDLNPPEESRNDDEVFRDYGMGIWYTVKEIA